jgi:transposase-like protein
MRKRKNRTAAEKIAAVEALASGVTYKDVQKQFKAVPSQLYAWRKQYAAGELQAKGTKGAAAAKAKTPEALFDDRARQAIILLRHAEDEVERMKQQKKLKEPDAAHLYAQLALRILQGDNGR